MTGLDPRLAELLRRGPPPPERLDPAHLAAVRAEARQAWFRQRARARRQALAFAAAACLAAGLAGWALRAGLEAPVAVDAAPATAIHAGAPTAVDLAAAKPQALRAAPPPAPAAAMLADAPEAAGFAAAEPAARMEAAAASIPAAAAMRPPVAAKRARAAEPAVAEVVAEAEAGPLAAPPDAPQRGRLLAAAAVLDAARRGRLAAGDRTPALRAALDSLDGLAHPAAEDLRRRLRAALAAP